MSTADVALGVAAQHPGDLIDAGVGVEHGDIGLVTPPLAPLLTRM